ncbi:TetR/AcrR family transcriptional regulator [Kibdelosporangium aridum]|uniref:TetR/AcrR family transcriptional regulator n=2 Tax=Kibdelosporangium aridum TaxID=2030 RepID=A0A428YXE1_KIBAR|nr:TetR/AcrR family transcriptional regulator [Kibdelosporangium aridum]
MRRDAETNLRRVVAAAAEVFASQGLDATLADVAKHAGVGVGTVYRRFANKDELIYEVYRERIRAAEDLAMRASEADDVWAAFVQFFESAIRDLAADRGLWQLTTSGFSNSLGWSRGSEPTRLAELLADTQKIIGGQLAKLVSRAKQAGHLRADFEAADMTVLSAAVQATITFGDDASRRALGFILDGLRQRA